MRQAMGVAVFSGMIGVTLFGLFLTPVFYVSLMTLVNQKKTQPLPESQPPSAGLLHGGAAPAQS
jgi:hypothetical protein